MHTVHGRLESGSTERDASEMVVSSYAKGDKQHRGGGDHRAERGERERGEQRGEWRMRIELLLCREATLLIFIIKTYHTLPLSAFHPTYQSCSSTIFGHIPTPLIKN